MTSTPETRLIDQHAEQWRIRKPEGLVLAKDLLLSPEQSRLSVDRYILPERVEVENRKLWRRVWQVACREESIPEPGDHLPYTLADQEILLVRQHSGDVRAFYNACRHRGSLIRNAAGHSDELRCPYHGWCWKLDGSLREIPQRHLVTDIADDDLALNEVACESWAGYVFVNPAGSAAEPLRDYLGDLVSRLEPFHMERQHLVSWQTTEVACNWKVLLEAFLEAFHVPSIHPNLVTLLDEANTVFERLGRHHRMWIPYGLPSIRYRDTSDQEIYESWLREHFRTRHLDLSGVSTPLDPSQWEPTFDEQGAIVGDRNAREYLIERQKAECRLNGYDFSELGNEQLIDIDHYLFFPNFVILAKADDTFMIRSRPHATDPDRSLADVMRLLPVGFDGPPPAARQQWIEADEKSYLENLGEVIYQDFRNVVRVQRGLHSRSLSHATLSANDIRIRWLHDDVDAYLQDAP